MFNCNELINESCDNDENIDNAKKVKDVQIKPNVKNVIEKV